MTAAASPKLSDQFDASVMTFEHRKGRGCYTTVIVKAGRRGTKRVVPPAGERYAFDVNLWARRVEISVSPSGRSVRVFVDGEEVK